MRSHKSYYAIKHVSGTSTIVNTWDQCRPLVYGVTGVKFKGFRFYPDALKWTGRAPTIIKGGELIGVRPEWVDKRVGNQMALYLEYEKMSMENPA